MIFAICPENKDLSIYGSIFLAQPIRCLERRNGGASRDLSKNHRYFNKSRAFFCSFSFLLLEAAKSRGFSIFSSLSSLTIESVFYKEKTTRVTRVTGSTRVSI